ncbi:transposase [Rhizobacter sp. SG703]|uniref:transposase n=1 Tax=Rhizobacter sp. SG703 TaxID=2587140 RepID=UPI0014485959|nr:transposase [Rhizobacter sp. SG703]NKI94711.1 transposase [Rhizobacter sp. SG703]
MLVSTSTLGGHVDTIESKPAAGGRRRRLHGDEFKADAVAAAAQPGVSMASVALARGINANLLRRWVRDAELASVRAPLSCTPAPARPTFVPMQLPEPIASPRDIRVELRRGATTIAVTWPMAAAAECASWMRELLR